MPIVRRNKSGAAVTVSDEVVDQYRAKGWIVDEKPRPSRRKTADDSE